MSCNVTIEYAGIEEWLGSSIQPLWDVDGEVHRSLIGKYRSWNTFGRRGDAERFPLHRYHASPSSFFAQCRLEPTSRRPGLYIPPIEDLDHPSTRLEKLQCNADAHAKLEKLSIGVHCTSILRKSQHPELSPYDGPPHMMLLLQLLLIGWCLSMIQHRVQLHKGARSITIYCHS